jgi:hypothetical protein
VKGKKPIVQKAIIFYKSDSTQSREDSSVDSWERWMMKQEDSGEEKDNDIIAHFFEKKNLYVGRKEKPICWHKR